MQWLKILVLLVGFMLVVAAGLETSEQRMFAEQVVAADGSAAEVSVADPLHQVTITCNRFLQSAARTVMDGVQSLLD
jgi:hypothetical protein